MDTIGPIQLGRYHLFNTPLLFKDYIDIDPKGIRCLADSQSSYWITRLIARIFFRTVSLKFNQVTYILHREEFRTWARKKNVSLKTLKRKSPRTILETGTRHLKMVRALPQFTPIVINALTKSQPFTDELSTNPVFTQYSPFLSHQLTQNLVLELFDEKKKDNAAKVLGRTYTQSTGKELARIISYLWPEEFVSFSTVMKTKAEGKAILKALNALTKKNQDILKGFLKTLFLAYEKQWSYVLHTQNPNLGLQCSEFIKKCFQEMTAHLKPSLAPLCCGVYAMDVSKVSANLWETVAENLITIYQNKLVT